MVMFRSHTSSLLIKLNQHKLNTITYFLDKTSLDSLKKSVNLSLEKIITNQDLFLESCHRVQMDESQIESEISVMLGKLIDMLETK